MKKSKHLTRGEHRSLSETALVMVVWRICPNSITDIMLDVVRYSKKTKHMVRSNTTTTIANIFKEKKSIRNFIDVSITILSDKLLNIEQHQQEILQSLQRLYTQNKMSYKPLKELNGYKKMLGIAAVDWRLFKSLIEIYIQDKSVNEQIFYEFVNKIFDVAMKKQISINIAIKDHHQLSLLLIEKQKSTKPDSEWMQNMFTNFDHKLLIKTETEIANHQKALNNNNDNSDNNTMENNYNTNKNGGGKQREKRQKKGNKIKKWTSNLNKKLKNKYIFSSSYCALHHMDDEKCKEEGKEICVFNGIRRSHYCLCGSLDHSVLECSTIYK